MQARVNSYRDITPAINEACTAAVYVVE